tara:strand:+ start:2181 stop:2351 length:171 start_codon:yes stop_codon:yes gene_type:complete
VVEVQVVQVQADPAGKAASVDEVTTLGMILGAAPKGGGGATGATALKRKLLTLFYL